MSGKIRTAVVSILLAITKGQSFDIHNPGIVIDPIIRDSSRCV